MKTYKGCLSININQVKNNSRFWLDGYKKFLNSTHLKPLFVPIRMRGLTSSGQIGRCYFNVENLVELFGGKIVVGWAIQREAIQHEEYNFKISRNIRLLGHAVWLNTQNRLSDPTAKSWITVNDLKSNESDFFGFMKKENKNYIHFIPLKVCDVDELFLPNDIILEHETDRNDHVLQDWSVFEVGSDKRKRKIDWNKLNESYPNSILDRDESWSDFLGREAAKIIRHKIGIFTERSITTNRTLNEIRADKSLAAIEYANFEIQQLLKEFSERDQ